MEQKERGEIVAWFWFGNLQGKGSFENQGIDGRIKDLKEIGWEIMDWISLAEGSGK
jgi:hypothetical protein